MVLVWSIFQQFSSLRLEIAQNYYLPCDTEPFEYPKMVKTFSSLNCGSLYQNLSTPFLVMAVEEFIPVASSLTFLSNPFGMTVLGVPKSTSRQRSLPLWLIMHMWSLPQLSWEMLKFSFDISMRY